MPETLGHFYSIGSYAWDCRALRAVAFSARSTLAFSAETHSSVAADIESSSQAVLKGFVNKDVKKKRVLLAILTRGPADAKKFHSPSSR